MIGDDAHTMLAAAVSTRNVILITDTIICINELVQEIQSRFYVALKPNTGKSMSLSVKQQPGEDLMVVEGLALDGSFGDNEGQFACAACDKKFSTSDALWKHSRCHEAIDDVKSATQRLHTLSSSKDGVRCPICEQNVPSRAALTTHIATKHSNKSAFGCGHCGQQFISSDEFRSHMQSNSCSANGRLDSNSTHPSSISSVSPPGNVNQRSEGLNMGTEESFSWSDRSAGIPDMNIPASAGHSVDAIAKSLHSAFGSSLDNAQIASGGYYSPAVTAIKPSVLHKCPLCPKQFTKSFQLNLHLARHNNTKQFPCKICSRAFNDNSNRLKHEKVCRQKHQAHAPTPTNLPRPTTGVNQTTFALTPSPSTDVSFSANQMRNTSLPSRASTSPALVVSPNGSSNPLSKRMFACRRCNKLFGDSSNRLRHEKRCPLVTAAMSGSSAANQQAQRRTPPTLATESPAKRRAVGLELPVSVSNYKQCAQTAEAVKVFDDRGKAVSMYSCQICGKLLQVRHSLELHYMSHLGIKPHVCSWCDKRFTDPSNWRKHCKTCSDRPPGEDNSDSGPPTMVPTSLYSSTITPTDDMGEMLPSVPASTIRPVKPEPIEISSDTSDAEQEADAAPPLRHESPPPVSMELADTLLVDYNQELGSQNAVPDRVVEQRLADQSKNAQSDSAEPSTASQERPPTDESVVIVDSALSWFVHDSDLTALSSQTEEIVASDKQSLNQKNQ